LRHTCKVLLVRLPLDSMVKGVNVCTQVSTHGALEGHDPIVTVHVLLKVLLLDEALAEIAYQAMERFLFLLGMIGQDVAPLCQLPHMFIAQATKELGMGQS